jgi:hypothetical protein
MLFKKESQEIASMAQAMAKVYSASTFFILSFFILSFFIPGYIIPSGLENIFLFLHAKYAP